MGRWVVEAWKDGQGCSVDHGCVGKWAEGCSNLAHLLARVGGSVSSHLEFAFSLAEASYTLTSPLWENYHNSSLWDVGGGL